MAYILCFEPFDGDVFDSNFVHIAVRLGLDLNYWRWHCRKMVDLPYLHTNFGFLVLPIDDDVVLFGNLFQLSYDAAEGENYSCFGMNQLPCQQKKSFCALFLD